MSITGQAEQATEALDEDVHKATASERAMAMVDATLAPAFRITDNIGVVSHSELRAVLGVVRQVFANLFAPQNVPEPGEPHDELTAQQARAREAAQPTQAEAAEQADGHAAEPAPAEVDPLA